MREGVENRGGRTQDAMAIWFKKGEREKKKKKKRCQQERTGEGTMDEN